MWLSIPGYEGWYEVSHGGQVRSVDREVLFVDGRRRKYEGTQMAQYEDGAGYKKVTLKKNGAWDRVHVHILVALAFHGPRPAGHQVRHYDGDHQNNHAPNLLYGTSKENHADTKRHGRARRHRKFSDHVVEAIKKARGRVSGRELSRRYGVSPAHVCNIQLGHRR
jgi:hypothetical protein